MTATGPSSPSDRSPPASSEEDRLTRLSGESLSGTVRRGALLSTISFAIVQVVTLAQIVVIARLLSPSEIGIYAAGTVLTGFVMSFSAEGMAAALVQRQSDVDDVADTVFWATMIGGLLSSSAVLIASPLLAVIFNSEMVGLVAATSAGTLFLHSLTVVPDALMQRRFNFKRKLIVIPVITISYAASGVVFAALGHGVWSLVWATYVSYVCWLIATWSVAGWRPGRGRPSFQLWRQSARFAGPLIVGGMIWHLREIFETVVVGRRLGENLLGQYRYGRRLCMMPAKGFADIASYVLFPAFSRMAHDPARLQRAYLRALKWGWLVAAPIAAMIVALGEPLVVLLLGQRWREAGLAFAVMAGFGLGEALGGVAGETVKGSGHSRYLYWMTGVGMTTTVGLVIWLVEYGLVGVGIAISVSSLLMGFTGVYIACRVTETRLLHALSVLARPTIAALLALTIVWPLEHLVLHSDTRGVLVGLLIVAAECLAYTGVFVLAIRILDPRSAAEVTGGVRGFLERRGRMAEDEHGLY